MKLFLTIFLVFILSAFSFGQNIRYEKPIFAPSQSNQWGADNVVLNNEPAGMMYGIQQSAGDIYIAICDTLSTTNLGLIIKKSTDAGSTWSTLGGISYRGKYENVKLIKSSVDSIYCFFQIDYSIFSWNIHTSIVNPFIVSGYRAFDVEISSTNSIYLFLDSLAVNSVVRYSSVNGGYNWGTRGSVSSTAAMPKITKSLSGDTLFLNYYGPVLADTAKSIIRVARYRELAAGTVASAGFLDLGIDTLAKNEYKMAINNNIVWFIYTVAGTKSEVWARQSIDAGLTYGTAFRINAAETVNQYWFDIKTKYPVGSGFDLVYYADSTQSGPSSVVTDKIMFGTAGQGTSTFSPFTVINDIPAVLSANNYKPCIIELPFFNNTAVAYVGETVTGKKVYWDSFITVPVELTSFTGKVEASKVVLNWSTATETNNKGFAIEKKTTKDWEKIGFVNGKGTTTNLNNYSFVDNTISTGKAFYRLNQVDFDGTVTYSKQIEVDVAGKPLQFELSQNYPNPFNPSTVISFQLSENSLVSLKVFDVLGNEVVTLVNELKQAGSHHYEFNASQLASGVYYYKIQAGSFTASKKLLLLK